MHEIVPEKHRLRTERAGANLTQRELAEIASISTSTISHIECHRGPDVPRDKLKPTRTKLSTALKLLSALACIAPGEYTLEQFAAAQSVFTEFEIFEAVKMNYLQQGRQPKRTSRRHLRAVA